MMRIPDGMRFGVDWEAGEFVDTVTIVAVVDDRVVGEFRGKQSAGQERRDMEGEGVAYLIRRYEWQQKKVNGG